MILKIQSKKHLKVKILSLTIMFLLAFVSLIGTFNPTVNAWFADSPVGSAAGKSYLYRANGSTISQVIGENIPQNGDLLQGVTIKETGKDFHTAVATFKPYNEGVNYQTDSDPLYRKKEIKGGVMMIVYNNTVLNHINFTLEKKSTTTISLNLSKLSTIENPTGARIYYTIEIAYKFRNHIISSYGNYILYKSKQMFSPKAPESFRIVEDIRNLDNVLAKVKYPATSLKITTPFKKLYLVNDEDLGFAGGACGYYSYKTTEIVKIGGLVPVPMLVTKQVPIDILINNDKYWHYCELNFEEKGTYTIYFHDLYGTSVPKPESITFEFI